LGVFRISVWEGLAREREYGLVRGLPTASAAQPARAEHGSERRGTRASRSPVRTGLCSRSSTSTRLITRSRGAIDRLALGLMRKVLWHPLDFGMQRRQLLNLKRFAETA
jgi:hypothetical protein